MCLGFCSLLHLSVFFSLFNVSSCAITKPLYGCAHGSFGLCSAPYCSKGCVLQEIDVQGKKAIIILVPVPQLRAYQKIQTRLVRELEKKFSGKHVVFIAQVGAIVSGGGPALSPGSHALPQTRGWF